MVTALSDLGYQIRLDPKHTSNEAIRRLSNNFIFDIELCRSKSFIALATPPDTPFTVKGKSLTSEDSDRASLLNNAQAKASALCVKSESASPSVGSTKSSTRKGRGQMTSLAPPAEHKFNKSDEGQKLFINKASLKPDTKLPQIRLNERGDGSSVEGSRPSAKHRPNILSSKHVGSWSLSYINQNLMEIDMSGFAPYGECGFFSTYGVKGHQAYTAPEKMSSTQTIQSVKQAQFTTNLKMRNKLYKNRLGLDLESRSAKPGLQKPQFLSKSARSKTLSEFTAETKCSKREPDKEEISLLKPSQGNDKQKSSILPGSLNLTRSNTCLVLPSDSPRGLFSKRKRGGTKNLSASKEMSSSKESLASISEKKTTKPAMVTTSTQTRLDETPQFSEKLQTTNSMTHKSNASPRRSDVSQRQGILFSSVCFDNPTPDSKLKELKSPISNIRKSDSLHSTPRLATEAIVEDACAESEFSPEPKDTKFQVEISFGRNMHNQST